MCLYRHMTFLAFATMLETRRTVRIFSKIRWETALFLCDFFHLHLDQGSLSFWRNMTLQCWFVFQVLEILLLNFHGLGMTYLKTPCEPIHCYSLALSLYGSILCPSKMTMIQRLLSYDFWCQESAPAWVKENIPQRLYLFTCFIWQG